MQAASSLKRKKSSGEIEIKVFDKNGKLIKVHRQKMHSLVTNLSFGLFYYTLANAPSPSQKMLSADNLSSPSGLTAYMLGVSLNGPFPNGIVLGYGVYVSPTSDAYTADGIDSPFYYGSSQNQMIYGSPSISLSQTTSESTITIQQTIRNSTAYSETVSELGLIGTAILTNSLSSVSPYINSASPYTEIAYDVISPSITVPSLGALQVTISINFD